MYEVRRKCYSLQSYQLWSLFQNSEGPDEDKSRIRVGNTDSFTTSGTIEFCQFCKAKHKNEGDSNLEAKTARLLSSPPLCGKDKMVPTGSNH